jgi:hypothetical protein
MSIVRTAYAFTPTSITGCALWLDGADSSTITMVTGVSQWNDKSGNGYNLTQGSTGSQPTRTGNLLNFVTNYNMNIPQAAINNASTWSMFFAVNPIASVNWFMAKQRDGVNSYNIFSTTQTGGPGPNAYFTGLTNYLYVRMFNAGTLAASSAALTMSQLQILSFVYDGTNMLIYINGNLSSTTAGSFAIQNDTSSTNFLLGQWFGNGTNYNSNGNFQLGELVYFNSSLTATQRQQVEGYLAQKWGLTASLPLGHPGRTSRIYRSDYLVPNKVIPTPYYTQFSPRQIPGCSLWLDAVDPAGNGVIPANGATVSTWVDKSGNSKNGSQVNNPTYDLARKAIYFSGSSQYYTLPDSTFPIGNTSYSYFIIANFTSLGTGSGTSVWAGVLGGGGFTPSTSIAFRTNGAGGGFYEYWYANDIFSSTTYATNQIVAIESFYTSGGQRSLIQNFSVTTTNTPSTPRNQSAGNNVIGRTFSNEYMMGYIYEVIVYNSALGTTERQQVESYLAQKWGLTASLPGGHSHFTKQAGAVTTVALSKFKVTGLPRIVFTATGGTIVTSGFKYHLFTSSSNFVVSMDSKTVNYLVVGGGGGGGDRHGGGGGGGGVLSGTWTASVGTYTVTVGLGGVAGYYETANSSPQGAGIKGGNSSLSGTGVSVTANGGGGGGTYDGNPTGTVGSGGGGGGNGFAGVAGTAGQGNAGGSGLQPGGGGGGGAGGVGTNANTGTGGIGTTSFSTHLLAVGYGTSFAVPTSPNVVISGGVAYIAAGGGGAASGGPGPGGSGGLGGGGRGDWNASFIQTGTANTGSGGGGSRSEDVSTSGRDGGSGLVLLWYTV